MAIALRPRASASTIRSRKGSQALALGARPGTGDGSADLTGSETEAGSGSAGGWGPAPEAPSKAGGEAAPVLAAGPPVISGWTAGGAQKDAWGSVDTPDLEMAGFDLDRLPRPRTSRPAALR